MKHGLYASVRRTKLGWASVVTAYENGQRLWSKQTSQFGFVDRFDAAQFANGEAEWMAAGSVPAPAVHFASRH
jgi:hypothetical protein